MAPVLPAETAALARPSPTSRLAVAIEDSGLARTARAPSSCEDTTSGAWTSSMRPSDAAPWRVSSSRQRALVPDQQDVDPVPGCVDGPFDRGDRRVVAPHAVEGDRRLGRPTPRSRRPDDRGSSRRRHRRGAASPGSRTGGSARGGSPRSRAWHGACRGAAWRSFASELPRDHHRSENSRKGSGPRAPQEGPSGRGRPRTGGAARRGRRCRPPRRPPRSRRRGWGPRPGRPSRRSR